jgi:hypothetical protein
VPSSIRVSSSNHLSHAVAARLHHRSTTYFCHHDIYSAMPFLPWHKLLLFLCRGPLLSSIRFCSFLPISPCYYQCMWVKFWRQSRVCESENPSIKNFWLHQFSTLGITFLHWPLLRHSFVPTRFPEHFWEISRNFFEAIMFLDLGNPFETLTIIMLFGVAVCYFATSSLLIACYAAP